MRVRILDAASMSDLRLFFGGYKSRVIPRCSDMKAVELIDNSNGTWTARIFRQTFTGTYAECTAWLQAQGESA